MKRTNRFKSLAALAVPGILMLLLWGGIVGVPWTGESDASVASVLPYSFRAHQPGNSPRRQPRATGEAIPSHRQHSPLSLRRAFNGLPMVFEENRGQAGQSSKFFARGSGYLLNLKKSGALLVLARSAKENELPAKPKSLARPTQWVTSNVQMELAGYNPDARITGENELPGKANYFVGSDSHHWLTGVPTYKSVRYQGIYKDTDLVYHGHQGLLEYDFIVKPGGRPDRIAVRFRGVKSISTNPAGDLLVSLDGAEVVLCKPSAYQEAGETKRAVAAKFHKQGPFEVGFEVGPYDRTQPLVIDPVLSYSTFLGGSGTDQGKAITVDAAGDVYVTGTTLSTNFPTTTGAFQTSLKGSTDIFVSKLDPTGATLLYSTYLGGSGDDESSHVAVDGSGDAFLTGLTASSDFPTTTGAFQTTLKGTDNCFVVELNPSGSALVYSTYLGGSSVDYGNSLALDSAGEAYVVGATESIDFPTTAGAFQTTLASTGLDDAFVTMLNSSGSALVYSTYLGGTSTDVGTGIAVDSTGAAYVTGYTQSTDFPTAAPFQAASGGSTDAFVTKLSPTGSALTYSSYLGGSGDDSGLDLALDSSLNAYVTGSTTSTNFPLAGAFQSTLTGVSNIFVSKVNAAGSALAYSTYLGGSGTDSPNAIAVDSSGSAYITGQTSSPDFPIADALQTFLLQSDAFVTKLDATGAKLDYSTYFGGSSTESGAGIAVDSSGNVYIAGQTSSPDLPVIAGSYQTTLGGATNAFVAKFGPGDSPAVSLFQSTLTFSDQSVNTVSAPQIVVLRNVGSGALTISNIAATGDFVQTNNCFSGIPAAAGCTVSITFAPASKGSKTGSVAISDNAAGSPHTIALSGKGIDTSVVLSPNSLTFPSQALGTTSAAQTVTLTDTGTDALPISLIATTGDFAQTNTCGTSVAAGASCAISVTFLPTKALARTGTILIAANAPGSPLTVQLSGTGMGPDVMLSSSSLIFGEQPVGTTSGPQTLTLTNDGDASLSIASTPVTGPFAQTNNCGTSLAAGANCAFTVTFSPASAGGAFGSLAINDNAPGSPHVVTLTGNAISGQAPEVSFSSTSMTFAVQPITTPSNAQSITLSNTGNAALTINSVAVTGDFTETNTCGTSVAAGGNCSIAITFTPKGAGLDFTTLTVTDNATGSPHKVLVTGTGTDFAFSSTTPSATVSAGNTATYTLAVNPVAGFNQQVSLACTGAPLNSTCTLDKPMVTLDGTNPANVTISVATIKRSTAPLGGPTPWRILPTPLGLWTWLLALLSFSFVLILTGRKPRLGRVLLAASLAAFLIFLSACAVGSKVTGTPAGTYSLTITGTTTVNGVTLTHSGNFGLTVN